MNILLLGGGGREHALAWKLAQSPSLTRLYAAPGNPGIAHYAELVPLDPADKGAVVAFTRENGIDLVVIGPEQPLVDGLADALCAAGIATFGPSAAAARLEGSKGFTKDLCAAHGIPTAAYRRCTSADQAREAVRAFGLPVVVKADGLAAGKGVTVATELEQADAAIAVIFAEDAAQAVVEEFLEGEEVSLFVLCDGATTRVLASAQDHKRVGEGDEGPNTGGMGAYSPATILTPELEARAMREIVAPTVAALAAAGTPFVGMLYAGLMLTANGPKLIEYNARFGDPETQVLMPRIASDFAQLLHLTATGRLAEADLIVAPTVALTVVVAAQGYPGMVTGGGTITGLEAEHPGITVFQAGTKASGGDIVASGGRVLAVTGTGDTIAVARSRAYAAARMIGFAGSFYRRDIGWREIARAEARG